MKMTDQEINEAVARKCGWEKAHELGIGNGVPDYCSDLNAMHEAENTLSVERIGEYENRLFEATDYRDKVQGAAAMFWSQHSFYRIAHADARQRAEAFLRTFNLWKE